MNIGILFGGISTEHEISIITAYQVKKKIEDRYSVLLLYLSKDGVLYDATNLELDDFKNENKSKLKEVRFGYGCLFYKKKKIMVDSVIIATHGINGEDGTAASLLDFYDIPYVGCDMYSSSICIDKDFTHSIVGGLGFNVTNYEVLTYKEYVKGEKTSLMPCIVKPAKCGSSIGISVCNTEEEVNNALELAFSYDDKVIVEELLKDFREYNMAASSEYLSRLEEIKLTNDFFSFENKYEDSFKQIHSKIQSDCALEEKIAIITRSIYDRLNMSGIIRIDFMVKDDKIYINEINTIPGALSNYLFEDFTEVIDNEIKNSFIRFQKKNRLSYTYGLNLLKMDNINK